jgi:hypothetical protein
MASDHATYLQQDSWPDDCGEETDDWPLDKEKAVQRYVVLDDDEMRDAVRSMKPRARTKIQKDQLFAWIICWVFVSWRQGVDWQQRREAPRSTPTTAVRPFPPLLLPCPAASRLRNGDKIMTSTSEWNEVYALPELMSDEVEVYPKIHVPGFMRDKANGQTANDIVRKSAMEANGNMAHPRHVRLPIHYTGFEENADVVDEPNHFEDRVNVLTKKCPFMDDGNYITFDLCSCESEQKFCDWIQHDISFSNNVYKSAGIEGKIVPVGLALRRLEICEGSPATGSTWKQIKIREGGMGSSDLAFWEETKTFVAMAKKPCVIYVLDNLNDKEV